MERFIDSIITTPKLRHTALYNTVIFPPYSQMKDNKVIINVEVDDFETFNTLDSALRYKDDNITELHARDLRKDIKEIFTTIPTFKFYPGAIHINKSGVNIMAIKRKDFQPVDTSRVALIELNAYHTEMSKLIKSRLSNIGLAFALIGAAFLGHKTHQLKQQLK